MTQPVLEIHSCSYHCDKPECIRKQRDELRDHVAQAMHSNAMLRSVLASSDANCVHCGLSADAMGTCKLGFPGCERANDMITAPKEKLQ